MRCGLVRIWPAALLACCLTGGCELGSVRNKYPQDPLLLSKKPVDGKIDSSKPVLLARAEPAVPPLPNMALVSAPPSREPPLEREPQRASPETPDQLPPTVRVIPAVRSGISSVVPGSPAVRRRTSGLYGSAPDHSWLQGVLESDDGRSYLRYADRAVDDPWGGKMALEDEPRLAEFRTGVVLMVEGEMITSEEGQPVYDSYHYPRYRIRNVWRVPEKQ